ncbi:hypothetical protein C8Q80DRAFT_249555 [Daedaleopsis nitida]|nr:hypothetical protein C8Q80DRAFT_249555 [Daedaleopsis nitida]
MPMDAVSSGMTAQHARTARWQLEATRCPSWSPYHQLPFFREQNTPQVLLQARHQGIPKEGQGQGRATLTSCWPHTSRTSSSATSFHNCSVASSSTRLGATGSPCFWLVRLCGRNVHHRSLERSAASRSSASQATEECPRTRALWSVLATYPSRRPQQHLSPHDLEAPERLRLDEPRPRPRAASQPSLSGPELARRQRGN